MTLTVLLLRGDYSPNVFVIISINSCSNIIKCTVHDVQESVPALYPVFVLRPDTEKREMILLILNQIRRNNKEIKSCIFTRCTIQSFTYGNLFRTMLFIYNNVIFRKCCQDC